VAGGNAKQSGATSGDVGDRQRRTQGVELVRRLGGEDGLVA